MGSPPRVRGKAFRDRQVNGFDGITPAYAGKRLFHTSGDIRGWDHPRVCGEKLSISSAHISQTGSPPRMRGKDGVNDSAQAVTGITPAYAGKSSKESAFTRKMQDHPRVCGEKAFGCRRCTFPQGSPPRMRGKGSRMTRATSMVGITPACAGKSARRQAGPPGPAPPPQMRSGWSPPPCTGRQCRTRKSTHARRARIPVPAHTPAPQ